MTDEYCMQGKLILLKENKGINNILDKTRLYVKTTPSNFTSIWGLNIHQKLTEFGQKSKLPWERNIMSSWQS